MNYWVVSELTRVRTRDPAWDGGWFQCTASFTGHEECKPDTKPPDLAAALAGKINRVLS